MSSQPLPSGDSIIPIRSAPGVDRDGTMLDGGGQHVDALWCRWDRERARKMGGYRAVNQYLAALPRALMGYTRDQLTYIHAGSASRVERLYIDDDLNTSVITNRTPASGFTADANNLWQFDVLTLTSTGVPQIIAQVAPNLADLTNSAGGELFTGALTGTSALAAVTTLPGTYSATGGIFAVGPYAIVLGSDGFIMGSVPGDPTDYTGAGSFNTTVTGQKLVRGMPLRGASVQAGLLWSADSLLSMSFIGGTAVFSFTTISGQTSILSAASVIEYDGIYYWIGTDRFLSFNGIVAEVPNPLNRDDFFDNLNWAHRQKVFAYKVPRFGEIWWCYPRGSSTEPDHAIIYNVRERTWYDTALPNGGRAAGIFPTVFRRPLMAGCSPSANYILSAVSAIAAAGTGYTVGDVLTLVGGSGTIEGELTVATVNGGGGVTSVSISNAGRYSTAPTSPVSVTGGTGSGATFTLTFLQPYKLWAHEIGTNEVDGSDEAPIRSYFETAPTGFPLSGIDRSTQVLALEPDFTQAGAMTVTAITQVNARAPSIEHTPVDITESAADGTEEVARELVTGRFTRFRFESNVLGGDYRAGLTLGHIRPADGRMTS